MVCPIFILCSQFSVLNFLGRTSWGHDTSCLFGTLSSVHSVPCTIHSWFFLHSVTVERKRKVLFFILTWPHTVYDCMLIDLFSFKDGPVQNYEGRNTLLLCHAITSLVAFLLAWLCPPEPRFHFRRDLIANGIPKKVNTFPLLADSTAKSMQK